LNLELLDLFSATFERANTDRYLAFSLNRIPEAEAHMLKVGDKAPAFRLKNDVGADVSLSDFSGKRVVLFFYPKANTSG
jgi:peroxiredoxin